ncbi:hypothetical protein, partial [Psychrobacter sp. DAB_AL62B]|uniref:hypothetical protein n=1 Tax=Psychrobacter sp. DAB_AL62B TaxID=1028420 RepID=UPI0023812C56
GLVISLQPRAPEYGQWRFYANAETKPRRLILFDKCLMVGMITEAMADYTLPRPVVNNLFAKFCK